MSGNYDDDSYGEGDAPPPGRDEDSYAFSEGAGRDGHRPTAPGEPDSPEGVERALDMLPVGQPNGRGDPRADDHVNLLDYASDPQHNSRAEPEFEEESEILRSRVGDEDFISPYQSVFGPVEPVDVDPNRSRRFRVDDSALRAEALEDQELSQILNPDIPRILNDPSRLNSHPGTKRSNLFLKRNFMAVESMLGKMARRAKRQGFDGLRDTQGRVNAVLAIRQKIDRKKRRKEGIKRLGTLAKIYQKQQAARCIERWSEALDRFHQKQQDKLRLAQVFVVMMGYKSKELARIALGRLIGLETILQKEAEQRKRRQGEQDLIRNMKEKGFRVCSELLRRLVLLRMKDALNRMHREAVCPYGGSRRKGPYARNAATMIIANIIGKKFDESAREGMEGIKEKNDSILRNPALAKRIAGLHNLKKLMVKLSRRKHGKRLFARMKILFNKKQRKGYSLLFESLSRMERKRKNEVFRKIFAQNIGLLQYQKLCTYFSGLFAKLVAAKRRRELVDSFNEVRRVAQREVARRRAARNLLIKLARIAAGLKSDVFNKVKIVPAVQEMFIFERDKYERSVRLRGALKIGNCFANYYRKFLFERVRKGFSWLRKFNHQFKIPAYYQRLDNFRVVFDERRKDKLHQAFHRLKGRSTFYLLQRYFRENIDLTEGLNEELLFALDKNIPSPHPKLQQVLEFWNTTYDAEDAPVLERDLPDDPPNIDFSSSQDFGTNWTFTNQGGFAGAQTLPMRGHPSGEGSPYGSTLNHGILKPNGSGLASLGSRDPFASKSPTQLPAYATRYLYPHNRHTEVCSLHCGSHTKNEMSPITKPRLSKAVQPTTASAHKSAKPNPRTIYDPPSQQTGLNRQPNLHPMFSTEDHAFGGTLGSEHNPDLEDFEKFLQQSMAQSEHGGHASEHDDRPHDNMFDSFSARKPNPSGFGLDEYDEALKMSTMLLNELDESRGKKVRTTAEPSSANVFHG